MCARRIVHYMCNEPVNLYVHMLQHTRGSYNSEARYMTNTYSEATSMRNFTLSQKEEIWSKIKHLSLRVRESILMRCKRKTHEFGVFWKHLMKFSTSTYWGSFTQTPNPIKTHQWRRFLRYRAYKFHLIEMSYMNT